eukprot:4292421-Prymnesium_polylepis.1
MPAREAPGARSTPAGKPKQPARSHTTQRIVQCRQQGVAQVDQRQKERQVVRIAHGCAIQQSERASTLALALAGCHARRCAICAARRIATL